MINFKYQYYYFSNIGATSAGPSMARASRHAQHNVPQKTGWICLIHCSAVVPIEYDLTVIKTHLLVQQGAKETDKI